MMRLNLQERTLVVVLAATLLGAIGCTSGPSGTYSDTMGSMVLELKSGGKANFTSQGDVADCTYSTSGKQLTVDCKGPAGKTVFTIYDDGVADRASRELYTGVAKTEVKGVTALLWRSL